MRKTIRKTKTRKLNNKKTRKNKNKKQRKQKYRKSKLKLMSRSPRIIELKSRTPELNIQMRESLEKNTKKNINK